jgi:hypothetical protein
MLVQRKGVGKSVVRGHFDVVDYEGFDRAFGGLELEAELLGQGGEDGGGRVAVGGIVRGPVE